MSNEELYNLIAEFKNDAKNIGALGEIETRVLTIVMDTFYFWFANRKLK